MTSDKAEGVSDAFKKLQFILGEGRLNLKDFNASEIENLLINYFHEVNIRKFRGFTELKDTLGHKVSDGDVVEVSENAEIDAQGFEDDSPFNLKTHTLCMTRPHHRFYTFHRYESDEETHDYDEYKKWGRSGYFCKGEEKKILLRRPPKFVYGDNSLVEVFYEFTKVSFKSEYLIEKIVATPLSLKGFCEHFSDKAPSIAHELLNELRFVCSRTIDSLKNDIEASKLELKKIERLVDSI
jgi:hypothetical protein